MFYTGYAIMNTSPKYQKNIFANKTSDKTK